MGMHYGILAATTSWPQFFAALSTSVGEFLDRGSVASINGLDLGPGGDESYVVAGDYQGSAFLLDGSLIVSATNYDHLVRVSRELECVVVACVGETFSGTFGLLAAQKGTLLRFYYNCISGLREPFQMGESLPTESVHSLEDIDGAGLFAVLKHFGLDYGGWYVKGKKQMYLYTSQEVIQDPGEAKGSIDAALREHWRKHEIPRDELRPPKVVARILPDGTIGYDMVASGPRQTILDRIRGLFSNR